MKMEKIYEFPIEKPLTAQRRKAVEKYISAQAELADQELVYNWDEDDSGVLHISASPVVVQVRFQKSIVELHAAAPLWARLLFTEKKKTELKQQIETLLFEAKFITARAAG
ncbi:hypothetical protein V5F32_03800 [Xanthobacter oligotrophicus]|uniref:Polyhydroxyalkanoic acid system protein n=1 Tax=Xanthobacter oligotrophicus TaxID=2607286 RepID=A0ABW6ZRE5_9HYPH